MSSIFWILVGAFVGWNLPQPQWAKNTQAKIVDFVSSKIK
jgi:hypothetical protein